jgi:hypothetical protein
MNYAAILVNLSFFESAVATVASPVLCSRCIEVARTGFPVIAVERVPSFFRIIAFRFRDWSIAPIDCVCACLICISKPSTSAVFPIGFWLAKPIGVEMLRSSRPCSVVLWGDDSLLVFSFSNYMARFIFPYSLFI